MEVSVPFICLGCLRTDRKLKVLDDSYMKQSFLRIIWEIATMQLEAGVSLCWECAAQLKRFIKFKIQVQKSYQTLQNSEQLNPECSSNLRIQNQYSINLFPDENKFKADNFEIVAKQEQNQVKQEIERSDVTSDDEPSGPLPQDGALSDYSEDDNKLLIELSNKEKGHVKKKTKKKKTKTPSIKQEVTVVQYYREIELSQEEIEEERALMSHRDDYTNALFRCDHCLISFPNADDLKDHITLKHELHASAHVCKICTCTFASEVAFNYHTNKHTRRFECVVCGARAPSKRNAEKHYENAHCARTNVEYDKIIIKDQRVENSINQETATFPCDSCSKVFKWKTSLRKHAEMHRIESGQKRRPYCDVCRLSFTTTSNLQKHVKTSSKHQVELKLRKMRSSEVSSEKHEARIEEIRCAIMKGREVFPCGQCDRKFQWRGNLLRHLHSHAARANGELVCEPCNRSFSSIATYKQHMKISRKHVSENDFKFMCTECGQKFANKTRLKDHVNWEHLKNYTHKCGDCQKVFKSHTSLYLHKQVVHKKTSTEHLCDHCGKPFPNRAKLRSHIVALHTVEAPFVCVTCGARFSWHSCLSRHVRRVHKPKAKGGGGGVR